MGVWKFRRGRTLTHIPPLSTRLHTIDCQTRSRVGTAQRVTREILIQTSLVSQRTGFINTRMMECSEEVRAWLTSIESCALGSLQSSHLHAARTEWRFIRFHSNFGPWLIGSLQSGHLHNRCSSSIQVHLFTFKLRLIFVDRPSGHVVSRALVIHCPSESSGPAIQTRAD